MKKSKKMLMGSIIIIAVIGGVYAYNYTRTNTSNNVLVTQKAEISSMKLTYDAQGIVEAKKIVNVFSNTEGVVKKVNYREGEEVKKGDVLLELKEEKYDIKKLNIEQSKLLLNKMKKDYEDAKKLYSLGAISKDSLDNAMIQYNDAVIKNKATMNDYKEFNKYVKSPISGVILKSNADVDFSIDPRKALFKIADTENLQIMVEVTNSMAKNLSKGDLVYITSDSLQDGVKLEGKIVNISNISFKSEFSNDTVTKVTVNLNNYANLKPGDLVEAKIVYKNIKDKIIIPFQYISNENGKNYVYLVKDGVVERREVTLGFNDGLNYEILSGIEKDQELLYNQNGQYKVGDIIK